jgi:hypothetical protein
MPVETGYGWDCRALTRPDLKAPANSHCHRLQIKGSEYITGMLWKSQEIGVVKMLDQSQMCVVLRCYRMPSRYKHCLFLYWTGVEEGSRIEFEALRCRSGKPCTRSRFQVKYYILKAACRCQDYINESRVAPKNLPRRTSLKLQIHRSPQWKIAKSTDVDTKRDFTRGLLSEQDCLPQSLKSMGA